MAVTLTRPTVLAKLADGNRTLEAEGRTLGDAIDNVAGRYPKLAPRLRDTDGSPYPFVIFYLNEEDIRLNGGFDAELHEGDEITIVPAIAGG